VTLKKAPKPYLLIAGHCTNLGGNWSGGNVSGARVVRSDCPGCRRTHFEAGLDHRRRHLTSYFYPLTRELQSYGLTLA
jgi:hypothetical protein